MAVAAQLACRLVPSTGRFVLCCAAPRRASPRALRYVEAQAQAPPTPAGYRSRGTHQLDVPARRPRSIIALLYGRRWRRCGPSAKKAGECRWLAACARRAELAEGCLMPLMRRSTRLLSISDLRLFLVYDLATTGDEFAAVTDGRVSARATLTAAGRHAECHSR